MRRRTFTIRPIGVVRSRVRSPEEAPRQGVLAGTEAEIVVDPACAEGLEGLRDTVRPAGARRKGGRIVVICWMHRADRARLTVHPKGRADRPERGVFATRSPHRPNPLSLHTVELLAVRGTVLRVRGMDAVDGTPVVDIKPHVPELDA